MLWKIYFLIMTGLSALVLFSFSSHTPWNLGQWYALISLGVFVLSLYSYAFKKNASRAEIWQTILIIEVTLFIAELIYQFSPLRNLIPIPEALQTKDGTFSGNLFVISTLLISFPYFYVLYKLTKFTKKSNSKVSVLGACVSLVLMALVFTYLLQSEGKIMITSQGIKTTSSGPCTRKHPYEMPTQVIQAWNIIKRSSPDSAKDLDTIYNCLNVQYKNLGTQNKLVEGAFIFDKTSSLDNLQIYIDSSFQTKSVEFTSLVLVHELTHVAQFISETYYKNPPDTCIVKEYQAWGNEVILLYKGFNQEEKNSIKSELNQTYLADPHAAALRDYITEINQATDLCNGAKTTKEKGECTWNNLRYTVQQKIDNSSAYQRQCNRP